MLTASRRILYAWQNPGVPVEEVMRDILHIFHHPALRDENLEVHRNMFATVRKWVEEQPDAHNLNNILSSSSVKAGRNHKSEGGTGTKGVHDHGHGALGGHGKTSGSIWSEIQSRDLMSLEGGDYNPNHRLFVGTPDQPGSPAYPPPKSPSYGYQNSQPGGGNNYGGRPTSSGENMGPNRPYSSYQAGPVSEYLQDFGGGYQQQQQQPPYGGAPYPVEQNYGGPAPQGQFWNQGGPPQPPYGQYPPQQYPPQQFSQQQYGQPQYPPQNQQPPYGGGDGGGGGFPGAGYHGGGY